MGLVKLHGLALAKVARQPGVSTSAISKIIKRASNKSIQSTTFPFLPYLQFVNIRDIVKIAKEDQHF
jgi:hypothetical protein